MDGAVAVRTIVPILLLIGMGFLSRKLKVLRAGDERVLNVYLYYFALPALLFVNMVETDFTEETLRFILAGIIPVLAAVAILVLVWHILRFSKKTLYLLVLSTVFGSLTFFGIPFVTFAFPGREGEYLATLSAASISVVSVVISITVLEIYRLEQSSVWQGFKRVAKRLSKNPLILSILIGVFLSLLGLRLPGPVSDSLHMLGGTTSAVAIFTLGAFLYGRKYSNLRTAFGLSFLRILFLPASSFLITMLFSLTDTQRTTLTLMHGMPVAISMIVLSERYDFFKETIASLILISSLGAGIYLNLWLLALGH